MSALTNVSKNGLHKNSRFNNRVWSNWIDELFGADTFSSLENSKYKAETVLPKANVKETKDEFVLELAVPGFTKNDFVIDLDNDVLTVSGENKLENKTTDSNYTRREFGYSTFKRTFTLPDIIEDSKISANYENGVLKVILPKRDEAKQKPVRTIKIS